MELATTKVKVTKESDLPNDAVVTFRYRKPGEAPSDRAVIVQEEDDEYIAGNDLIRGGWRKFKRDRISGNISVWGKVSFSDLLG